LHIVGDDVFLQSLRDGGCVAGFKVQQQFVWQNKQVEIALHLALGGGERSVTALADAKLLHIVRNLAVEKTNPVRARKAKAAAELRSRTPAAPRSAACSAGRHRNRPGFGTVHRAVGAKVREFMQDSELR
jgi:hypothetical protein